MKFTLQDHITSRRLQFLVTAKMKVMENQGICILPFKYGLNSISKEVPYGTTVSSLLNDVNLKAALGCGDNVEALLNLKTAPWTPSTKCTKATTPNANP